MCCTPGNRTQPSEPPGNDNLPVRKELYGVLTLAVQIAEERVLVAREWEVCHRSDQADVDPDVADLASVSEIACRLAALGVDRRSVPERTLVDEFDRLIEAL